MGDKIHVSVGNLNADITLFLGSLPDPDSAVEAAGALVSPGGAATNYAVAAARYGHYPYLVASAGNDRLSEEVLARVAAMGVNTRYVKRVEASIGLVVSLVTRDGERRMVKYRGANEYLSPTDLPRHLLREASVVHVASIPPLIAGEMVEVAGRSGALVSYDPGAAALAEPERVARVAARADVLFLNRTEARAMYSGLRGLLRQGLEVLVIKRGSAGAVALTPNSAYVGTSRPVRQVVNATGSGDALAAYFNAAYVDYGDVGRALLYGVAAGTLKASCKESHACWDRGLFEDQLSKASVSEVRAEQIDKVLEGLLA
ncbi:MAG: PfkB family carbohydrate kinase [Desulfurococcaceae archaeon]